MTTRRAFLAGLAVAAAAPASARANGGFITLGSTTTTENSGLLGAILPVFEAETGIAVRVVVAGTGRVLRLAEAGDIDVALVHDRIGEDAFIASGLGAYRRDVMRNDFLIVGPAADPAGLAEAGDAVGAMKRIAAIASAGGPTFVSRGDDSGTHRRERALWAQAGVAADAPWLRETGAGMGATLNVASATDAYTLVDRGSWAAFGNRGDLSPLFEGGQDLDNPYGAILPSPARHPHLKTAEAERFISWLISSSGRAAIEEFRINGEQVFFPVWPAGD